MLVLPAAAGAAEIVDRNVAAPELQVNSRNVALVTYSVKGVKRNVLYWGAVNWAERFKRDYSGGWKSKIADHKRFTNSCKPYTGPRLPLMIAGCDAKDGSHWALQQWQRLWSNYGGSKAANELYISHWKGDAAELAIQTDHSYHGKHQHLWGKFTFHGKPVFGTKWTIKGVPLDRKGRNIYVDYLDKHDLAPGQQLPDPSAHRRLLLHVREPPGLHVGLERAGNGRCLPRHRDRPRGHAARTGALRAARSRTASTNDAAANAAQSELLSDDARCRID